MLRTLLSAMILVAWEELCAHLSGEEEEEADTAVSSPPTQPLDSDTALTSNLRMDTGGVLG